MTTSSQVTWDELVRRAETKDGEPDFDLDRLYPVVYFFGNGRTFRDSGPEKGIYQKA